MRWISSHKIISLISALVIFTVALFVFSVISGGGNPVSRAVNTGVAKITSVMHGATAGIRENAGGIFSYKKLQSRIAELEEENSRLKLELAENRVSAEQLDELERLSEILNYNYSSKKIEIVSGDLISEDGSGWSEVFMINVGEDDGVAEGAPVINGQGLIGKIRETGRSWSKVISITDSGERVSFKLARSGSQLGICYGDSKGGVSGYMMEAGSNVAAGDVIITSGLGLYPEGIEIGNVKNVKYNSDTLLKELEIEPAVNFRQIDKVTVLR